MKTIVLDTNFLIYAAKYKIDIAREIERLVDVKFELLVPTPVLEELKAIAKKSAELKTREAASLALDIIKSFKKARMDGQKADDACLSLALSAPDGMLATMDLALRKRFKKGKKGRFLVIRQEKYLALV